METYMAATATAVCHGVIISNYISSRFFDAVNM